MPKFLLLLLTLCLIGVSVYAYGKDVTDLINEMGYPVETHYATTDDGFVLAMHRIPTGRSSLSNSIPQNQKKVVFLQHGLLDSSATWVNNFPHQSLGYVLADQGYDVWMGNARGNLYSSKHLRFTKEDKQYWNFSWDEMASYDLVTMVNYALKTTGQQKLAYVGHSQGTTMGFACFTSSSNGSNKPHLCPKDFANKISVFIAIAPVTFVNHATNDMFHAVAHLRLAELIEATGHHEFLPSTDLVQELLPNLCKKSKMDKNFCLNIYCITGGCDNSVNHVNMTRLPVYFARLPAGTSTKNMIHWAQMVRKNNFQMLDRGLIGNRRQYGQFSTPQYNLKNLSVDVALYHGGLDVLGDVEDFKQAFKQIPKSRVKTVLFYPDYGHFDFMWGIHAYKDVYPDILLRIKESFN